MPARKWSIRFTGALSGSLTVIAIFGLSAVGTKAATLIPPKSVSALRALSVVKRSPLQVFTFVPISGVLNDTEEYHSLHILNNRTRLQISDSTESPAQCIERCIAATLPKECYKHDHPPHMGAGEYPGKIYFYKCDKPKMKCMTQCTRNE